MNCKHCNGQGSTAEHDIARSHDPETGECISCPVQVQCEHCEGKGTVVEKVFNHVFINTNMNTLETEYLLNSGQTSMHNLEVNDKGLVGFWIDKEKCYRNMFGH